MGRTEITIVGAGIAGLTCAVALAQKGFPVRVLEQAPGVSEVGAGLQITPNGVAVLDALGLADKLRAVGMHSKLVTLRDYQHGKSVARLDMTHSGGGRPYLLLHRSDLINLLADAARDAGVKIEVDRKVTSVDVTSKTARLVFEQSELNCPGLVIGADGLHSQVRRGLNGVQAPFFTGQVAWRAVVDGSDTGSVNVYMAPGRHVVTYPLRGGTMTNIVGVEERKEFADEGWDHASFGDEFRTRFSHFCPDVTTLLDRVEDARIWGLFRHPVAKNWHNANCALIGDAAHPTLPFLAQGANMAIEDAWVLADCLSSLPMSDALATYQQRRKDRVTKIVAAANANARNYHLRNPLVRLAAHTGLRALNGLAPGKLVSKFDWVYDFDVTKS